MADTELAQEAERLNDFMQEAFGERPVHVGMEMTAYNIWLSRLQLYWLTRMRTAVMTLEASNLSRTKGIDQ